MKNRQVLLYPQEEKRARLVSPASPFHRWLPVCRLLVAQDLTNAHA